MSLAEEFAQQQVVAVVGASQDRAQVGFRVYTDLKNKGYTVYAVNPNIHNILGDTCYRSLRDLPQKPDVVSVILETDRARAIVTECHKLGITRIWLEPGVGTPSLIRFCEQKGLHVVSEPSIIEASTPRTQP